MQHPENDISSRLSLAQRRLIETYLATGNPSNPKFRRLCYAAFAHAFHRYLASHLPQSDTPDRARLEKLVVSTVLEKEREFGGTESISPFIARLFNTEAPNGGTGNSPDDGEPPPPASVQLKPYGASSRWRSLAWGIFFGASAVFLGLKVCNVFGLIYIYHYPENFLQLENFNHAVESLSPSIKSASVALEEAERKLTSTIQNSGLDSIKPDDIFKNFKNIRDVFPDFFESYKGYFPRNSKMIVKLSRAGGYKILFESEICGAFVAQHPETNDTARNSNGIFCNYFGVWNDKGKGL